MPRPHRNANFSAFFNVRFCCKGNLTKTPKQKKGITTYLKWNLDAFLKSVNRHSFLVRIPWPPGKQKFVEFSVSIFLAKVTWLRSHGAEIEIVFFPKFQIHHFRRVFSFTQYQRSSRTLPIRIVNKREENYPLMFAFLSTFGRIDRYQRSASDTLQVAFSDC